jgi:hypothetical protein
VRLTPSSDVVLAVEVLSSSSVRTDTVIKPLEYADAGIPHLWLIDPQPPVTATVYRLVDGQYEESQRREDAGGGPTVPAADRPGRLAAGQIQVAQTQVAQTQVAQTQVAQSAQLPKISTV